VYNGADIMFVVDRSGSIDGNRTPPRTPGTEWDQMLNALNDSIRLLLKRVPAPQIGLVSFGGDASDTGDRATAECGVLPECNWREPDQKLSSSTADLIDDKGTPATGDDEPKMRLADVTSTNLSLGISIAGAELMGKLYPHTNNDVVSYGIGDFSGEFERIVEENNNFSLLPDQNVVKDRSDLQYPDIIVVITDGEPNGIMSHKIPTPSDKWHRGAITSGAPFDFISLQPYKYNLGVAKTFRTSTGGSGLLIADDVNDLFGSGTPPPLAESYIWCNDAELEKPSNIFALSTLPSLKTNRYPHMAMCNATLIADKLKSDAGITFIAIYVGTNPASEAAVWLKDYLVDDDGDGKPLFAQVDEYGDIQNALLFLFENLDIINSR
jgi:hypothetical protein